MIRTIISFVLLFYQGLRLALYVKKASGKMMMMMSFLTHEEDSDEAESKNES